MGRQQTREATRLPVRQPGHGEAVLRGRTSGDPVIEATGGPACGSSKPPGGSTASSPMIGLPGLDGRRMITKPFAIDALAATVQAVQDPGDDCPGAAPAGRGAFATDPEPRGFLAGMALR
jgi:hypothetical protein